MSDLIDPLPARTQLLALLRYLENLDSLKSRPALTAPEKIFCRYESDLQELPGVALAPLQEGRPWLRINRMQEEGPPRPLALLKDWLELSDDPDQEPRLREEIAVQEKGSVRSDRRDDHPEIEQHFRRYLHDSWRPWADVERLTRRSIALYDELHALLHVLDTEAEEDPPELVWGIGVAVWQRRGLIRHPLITQVVGLSLKGEAIEVHPAKRLPELDMGPFAEVGASQVAHVQEAWQEVLTKLSAPGVLTPRSLKPVFQAAASHLDAGGAYRPRRDDAAELPEPTDRLVVTDTHVLFARSRSHDYYLEDLQQLRASLESLEAVPPGPAALVTRLPATSGKPVHFRGLSYMSGAAPDAEVTRELYFPKPYNKEQVGIIERLERAPGVVVQGPPGTGKTHTIANVICHFLATGRRVLVTAKSDAALDVLRGQIPESVRHLCVALLADDDGLSQFEHAIQTLTSTLSQSDPEVLQREIKDLEARVEELHGSLRDIDWEIDRWARRHLQRVRYGELSLFPEALARRVLEEEGRHAWFPDTLNGDLQEPSLTQEDMAALREARREVGKDLVYLEARLPALENLPDPETMARYHEALTQGRSREERPRIDTDLVLRGDLPSVLPAAEALVAELTQALRLQEQMQNGPGGLEGLHRAYLEGMTPALQALEELIPLGKALEEERLRFLARPVDIPEAAESSEAFLHAINRHAGPHLAMVERIWAGRNIRAFLATIRVEGRPPTTAEDWQHVATYVRLCLKVRSFLSRWNLALQDLRLTPLRAVAMRSLRLVASDIQHVERVRDLAVQHHSRIRTLCGQVFRSHFPEHPLTMDRDAMQAMIRALTPQIRVARARQAQATLTTLQQTLTAFSGPVVEDMRQFLQELLGRLPEEGAAARRWAQLLDELQRIVCLAPKLQALRQGCHRVERAGARKWADKLRTEPVAGEDPWTPSTWLDSWRWHQAHAYLEAIDGRVELQTLQSQRTTAERDLASAYGHLVDKRTWLSMIRNTSETSRSALVSCLNSIRRRGKGKGVRAARYRAELRAQMTRAVEAVPCWILPQDRVSETLPPTIGHFDLVVVDEASQSDLWALLSLLRGQKLLVVGDERQVSPDAIGIKEEQIKDLKSRFLDNQVYKNEMTPEKSLYDLAQAAFHERLMLREHFRSVAPIIEFSRREFYHHQIQPLRLPKGSERLDPPLIDVFVHGATRSGRDNGVNEAEAQAIVAEIREVLADKAYKGRTIGVVSLLGSEQADRIRELINGAIPRREIDARQLAVGDARTFQGKERDIMFLSMVATPDSHVAATAAIYEQRFNVAASRARDRMYLFRSVNVSDLRTKDLKARLIEHFQAPFHELQPTSSGRERCESDFERAMFDELSSRGYRVQPQVSIGDYRIDFVVSGPRDLRLAIECDGDKLLHGTQQWNIDIGRQRVLERAGWTFWRCFGSSFYLKRQVVMDNLIETLQKMGIPPIGADESEQLERYTEHREVTPRSAQAGARSTQRSARRGSSLDRRRTRLRSKASVKPRSAPEASSEGDASDDSGA